MIHGVAGRRFSFRHGGDKVIGAYWRTLRIGDCVRPGERA